MKGMRITFVGAVSLVVLLAVVLLTACQGQPAAAPTAAPAATTASAATKAPAPPATTASAPAAATSEAAAAAGSPQTLNVGGVNGLTGPTARNALMVQRTWQMLIDDVNAKGGLKVGNQNYRINMVFLDDKNTAEGGREVANRLLLAEKVKIIMGPSTTTACAGAQPLVEQQNALMFTVGCAGELLGPKHPTSLSAGYALSNTRVAALLSWLKKAHPEAKSVAFFVVDDANGKNDQIVFKAAADDNGQNLVDIEAFPMNTTDFSPIVARTLVKKPDVVALSATAAASGGLSVGIIKALSEQNYKGLVVGSYTNTTAPFLQAGRAVEGYVGTAPTDYNVPVVPAAAKDISSRFIQKYGQADFDASIVMYVANNPMVLFQALEKAGTVDDPQKIADVLRSNQWDTVFGKMGFGGTKTFGAPSYLEAPVYFSKVEGGKWVTFDVQQPSIP